MKKSGRRKVWFKRVSAMIMTVALVLSGISVPDGLFSITAKAAEKLSATWSPTNSTLTDASGADQTASSGGVVNGKLTNEAGNIINITGGQFRVRNGNSNCDFLVNANTVMELPVVSGAKSCTVTLVSFDDITTEGSVAVSGMSNVEIKNTTGKGSWDTYTITGDVDKKQNSISLTLGKQKYFKSVTIDSSTSYAVTSAAFKDEETSEAVWDYTGKVTVASNKTSIESATGTYTNNAGDVLYVDATYSYVGADNKKKSAKFAPQTTDEKNLRIQVNKGTKMVLPAKGDKAVITLLVNKNNIKEVTDNVLTKYFEISGKVLRKAKCIENVADTADSAYRKVTIEAYLTGDEGEITLNALDNTYIRSIGIACSESVKKQIKGTITSNTELSDDMQVIATNKTTGFTYTSDITIAADGKSGTYSIEVPVEAAEMEYELSLSDASYDIKSGTTVHKVSTATGDITADMSIIKLSTCVVTGKISGIAEGYNTDELEPVFKAEGKEYAPEVTVNKETLEYTAKFEKGVSYSVTLNGANDYEVTSGSTGAYTEDTVLNITAALKPTYAVTVNLPEEPDMSGKKIEYTYTNKEDGYTYTFDNKENIKLRDGSYTLTLGGDFLAQPYKITAGDTVVVKGEAATQTLTFEQVTSWSFASEFKDTIQNKVAYYNGLILDTTNGKVRANGNSAQLAKGTKITIPVSGKCTISVEAYQAGFGLYTIGGEAASTTEAVSTYRYDFKEAGTVDIVSTADGAYIKSISLVYDAKEVEYKEQPAMPKTYEYGTAANLVVQPTGQRLVLTQTGGALTTVNGAINKTVSFYGFDETTAFNKLTADVTITSCGSSNSNGIFVGAFDKNYMFTAGIRNSNALKMIYSKKATDLTGASSKIDTTIPVGTVVTFTVERTATAIVITATPKGGEKKTISYEYNKSDNLLFKTNGKESSVAYGFVLAGVEAVVQNMKYVAADGTVLYDQNDCYKPAGTAPVVKEVKAEAAKTRDYITVSWSDEVAAAGDGVYVLQASKDGGDWEDVETELTSTSYKYAIKDAGEYKFRVCGKLGVSGERNAYATADTINVIAALDSPVIDISSTATKVSLKWNAVDKADTYEVYRYSYDDTEENTEKIATVKETSYEDSSVTEEMPYYYYVVAYSHIGDEIDNYSNPSDTVWAVPTAGHKGEYVYEDEAVKYTITKKSYDTVYDGKITIEGVVEDAVTATLNVNGNKAGELSVKSKEAFSFKDIAISEGRNDVELLLTDKNGNITRETFNYVYLTNYNKVVDRTFTGTDGELVNGIPTYKTVQNAVDSVAADNKERVVILVKEGDYEEHIVVASPYITLIGEDSEKTRIYYDTKEWKGGDMSLRCAVKIDKTATGFSAENLTIENTYEYVGDGSNESCDALRNDANETSYVNLRILGYQDTLCANGGTQYYYKCYIAGNVDFIYGNEPRALFNDCRLVFRYNAKKNAGYVCAPKTADSANYGLTFNNCQILSEDGCSGDKYKLARPWGQGAYITWINCYMGKVLKANTSNPYADMSPALAVDARFFEYGSYGPAYAINSFRRQISANKAEAMTTAGYLGWNPYTAVADTEAKYKGSIKTEAADRYVEKEYISDTYDQSEGDDKGLGQYALEGYAASAGVTGGGLLKETSDNYYKAGTAEDFLKAIQSIKNSGKASVIELTADIGLGDKEVNNFSAYSSFITAHKWEPLTHPTLLKTGVSMLKLADMSNLTIYSKNGAKITHTCIDITGSSNIIIRNIEFDEIWEWDDDTEGNYDRNDWDYMTIEKGSSDIWVDHCTFYKAYDGVIDVKTPANSSNITISWCEFLPASEDSVFFDVMMNAMKAAPDNYPYYKHLLEEGMTEQQIYNYAYGQKKTHLLGQSDDDSSAKNITLTLANNYYKNSMDRMPRLRYGTAHVYNCIMDAQDLREMRLDIEKTNPELAKKIVSNGAASNCGAHMLLENCYMSGITNAIISGNGNSPAGYINAFNTVYMLDGKQTELKVTLNTSKEGEVALVQDKDEFKSALPYKDYVLYAADSLSTEVQPYTGAGKLNSLTALQWEKTSYNTASIEHTEHVWNDGEILKEATCTDNGLKVYTCKVCGETKKEDIKALGHSYSEEWTVDKEATTTEEGSKSHHCTVCGDKKDITVIPKLEESKPDTGKDDTVKDDTVKDDDNKGDIKDNANVEVVKKDNVPDTAISSSKDEILESVLDAEELEAVKAGAKVEVSVDVSNADETVSEAHKTLISNQLKAEENIGVILDINVLKTMNGKTTSVHNLKKAITFKIEVPEKLVNKDASKQRIYSIIRIHDGKADRSIAAHYNESDNTITFETDGFSTYAIVYKDDTKPAGADKPTTGVDNPTTGADKPAAGVDNPTTDNSNDTSGEAASDNGSADTADTLHMAVLAWLFLMVISGLAAIYVAEQKKKVN